MDVAANQLFLKTIFGNVAGVETVGSLLTAAEEAVGIVFLVRLKHSIMR